MSSVFSSACGGGWKTRRLEDGDGIPKGREGGRDSGEVGEGGTSERAPCALPGGVDSFRRGGRLPSPAHSSAIPFVAPTTSSLESCVRRGGGVCSVADTSPLSLPSPFSYTLPKSRSGVPSEGTRVPNPRLGEGWVACAQRGWGRSPGGVEGPPSLCLWLLKILVKDPIAGGGGRLGRRGEGMSRWGVHRKKTRRSCWERRG